MSSSFLIHEDLFMDPFSKWRKYRIIPVSPIVHILLAVISVCQAFSLFEFDIPHQSKTIRQFNQRFNQVNSDSLDRYNRVHELSALREAINHSLIAYFQLPAESLVPYSTTGFVDIRVHYRSGHSEFSTLDGNSEFADGFTEDKLKQVLESQVPNVFYQDYRKGSIYNLKSIECRWEIIDLYKYSDDGPGLGCNAWEVVNSWSDQSGGEFLGSLDATINHCRPDHLEIAMDSGILYTLQPRAPADQRPSFLFGVTLVYPTLALISIIAILKSYVSSIQILSRIRWRCLGEPIRISLLGRTLWQSCYPDSNDLLPVSSAKGRSIWESLTYYDILSFFSPWWVITLVCNFFQLLAALLLATGPSYGHAIEVMGISCFLSLVVCLQYYEFWPRYYTLFETLSRGFPRIFKFLGSIFPIFLAYVVLGVCLFWKSSMFESATQATAVLFSIGNGDTLLDMFNALYQIQPVLSQLYLYTFLSLFIYVVLNVNISVIEEAYISAVLRSSTTKPGLSRRALNRINVYEVFLHAFPDEADYLQEFYRDNPVSESDNAH